MLRKWLGRNIIQDLLVDSFITVFILCNEGLGNKLIRAPLLGLAKSIHYVLASFKMQELKFVFKNRYCASYSHLKRHAWPETIRLQVHMKD